MIVDWQQACLNIRAAGLPLVRADKQVSRHKDYLNKLARGEIREPKWSDGMRLLNLHVDVCGAEKTKLLMGE